jgi:hypothetical protein
LAAAGEHLARDGHDSGCEVSYSAAPSSEGMRRRWSTIV